MPYIITTTRTEVTTNGAPLFQELEYEDVFRRAVVTLDEARNAVRSAIEARTESTTQDEHDAGAPCPGDANEIDERGGTVGPLPDGTTIEVEQVSLTYLGILGAVETGKPRRSDQTVEQAVDAYNATQEAQNA